LDETSFLKATRVAPTRWVTGLVDLERGRLLDVVADRTRAAVDSWLGARSAAWLACIGTVALDPWRGYASALVAPLGHATVVVDHFHAVRLANLVVDQVRRRTQQATLGHRGRKRDRLYCSRKPAVLGPPAVVGRHTDLQLLGHLGDLVALSQQPVGFPQLAHDLLGRAAASLHRVLLPVGAIGLSYQLDQSQGVGSAAPTRTGVRRAAAARQREPIRAPRQSRDRSLLGSVRRHRSNRGCRLLEY
jgi:Transposase